MKSKQPRKKIKCHLCLLCVLSNKILSTSHRPPTSPGQPFTKLNKLHIAPSNEVIWRTHTYVRMYSTCTGTTYMQSSYTVPTHRYNIQTHILYPHNIQTHVLLYCTHIQLQRQPAHNPKACQWNKGHPMQTLLELTAHQTTFHCGHYSSHASHLLQFTHSNGCPGSTAPNH